jgi:hypothetical protein
MFVVAPRGDRADAEAFLGAAEPQAESNPVSNTTAATAPRCHRLE